VTASRRFPQMTVVDWNAESKDHEDWLQPDGIHLTAEGARGMATMVNNTLVQLGVALKPTPPATTSPLTIASRWLPLGHRGQSYAAALRASGGKAPYRWKKTGGLLPAGLRLTSAGRVTGTPAGRGSFTLQAKVVDRVGTARTQTFRLRVV
jgi:Putative Ig domain